MVRNKVEGGVCTVGPVRAAAAADGRLGGVSGRRAPAGRLVTTLTRALLSVKLVATDNAVTITMTPPNRMRRFLLATALPALLIAACGDGGPTAPSTFPQVAGTYDGQITLSSSLAPEESLTGQMQMVVVQDGEQLTITASITLFGETTEQPAITGTIDENGSFTVASGEFAGTDIDPECGTSTVASFTLMFSGSMAKLQVTLASDSCGTFTLDGDLTR